MEVAREEKLDRVYDLKLLRWVWNYVHPYRRLFFLSVVLMPLNSLFALAQPYIWKLTIDLFLTHNRAVPPGWLKPVLAAFGSHGLLAMGFVYLLLVAGEFSTFYGQFYLTMMVAQYSLSDLRMALFKHVERLPMSFFDRTPTGRLVSRMTTDIDAINEMFSAGSLTMFIDVLTMLVRGPGTVLVVDPASWERDEDQGGLVVIAGPRLEDALAGCGVDASEVTHVAITHAHHRQSATLRLRVVEV